MNFDMLFLLELLKERDTGAKVLLAVMCIIASLLWIIFIKKMFNFFIRMNIRAVIKNGKLPYGKNTVISFRDGDILDITEDTELKIKYDKIENIAVTEHAVYIYTNALQAFILPLNLFADKNSVNVFVQFFDE